MFLVVDPNKLPGYKFEIKKKKKLPVGTYALFSEIQQGTRDVQRSVWASSYPWNESKFYVFSNSPGHSTFFLYLHICPVSGLNILTWFFFFFLCEKISNHREELQVYKLTNYTRENKL